MTDIVAFLTARLDEDEAAAHEAAAFYDDTDENGVNWSGHEGENQNGFTNFWLVPHLGVIYDPASGRHIVRHDPARVLREVVAKRAIIALLAPEPRAQLSDAEMHKAWNHPAYEYDKTEGQRKAWDRADEPPEGAGWERNVDAGRGGWDRLDYTEESYWRRLRPDGPAAPYVPRELRILAAVYADHPDYVATWRP